MTSSLTDLHQPGLHGIEDSNSRSMHMITENSASGKLGYSRKMLMAIKKQKGKLTDKQAKCLHQK